MKTLIIEDEISASKRLKNMLKKIDPTLEITATIDSIEDAVNWLNENDEPDLIFADIQLSDGVCFEIFRQVKTKCPVIFTTAYDEYAIEAFKVNSIDYLLKPIDQKVLEAAIEKFKSIKERYAAPANNIESLLKQMSQTTVTEYKSRFLVKKGQAMKTVSTSEAAYFIIDNQLVFLVAKDGGRYVIEHSLDELEAMLDPALFFRINRQMIISLESVTTIHPYFNSRLKLMLEPVIKAEILVSRMKVSEFKKWLDQ